MLKTLFSKNLGPFTYLSQTYLIALRECSTWSLLRRNILSHIHFLFSNMIGKQSRDVAAINIFFSI